MKRTALLLALLTLAFCAAHARAAEAKDLPRGEVQPDKALVYFLRPAVFAFSIPAYAYVDDRLAGVTRGNDYFFVQVEPGRHIFWSMLDSVDALELTVDAGRTYYLRQKIVLRGFFARTAMEVLDAAKAERTLAKDVRKHAVMTDKARARGEERARKYWALAQQEVAKAAAAKS